MKQVVKISIGIPASGKSTWAAEERKKYQNGAIVERDKIRDKLDPDWRTKNTNKKFEKQVTEIFFDLLGKLLKDRGVDAIFISDTNLDKTRLENLEVFIRQHNTEAEISRVIFEDSFDLYLCLERNRKREHTLPDSVICKFYRKFLDFFECEDSFGDRTPLYVGDIHSQIQPLLNLLNSVNLEKHFLVFLGDLNDSRTEAQNSNFLEVHTTVKDLVDTGNAVLIHSNHQKNLVAALRGKRRKLSHGLNLTLRELEKEGWIKLKEQGDLLTRIEILDSRVNDMAAWYDTRPYFHRWLAPSGTEFIGVHAQYLPQYCVSPYNVSGRGLEALIYGTRQNEERVKWWETYKQKPFVVAGHYHEVFISNFCAVIDSGCGQDGFLSCFDPLTNVLNHYA